VTKFLTEQPSSIDHRGWLNSVGVHIVLLMIEYNIKIVNTFKIQKIIAITIIVI